MSKKEVNEKELMNCPICNGKGKVWNIAEERYKTCARCKGKGFVNYKSLPPQLVALLRGNMQKAGLVRTVNFLRKKVKEMDLRMVAYEKRHTQILQFLMKILKLYRLSRKNNIAVGMQRLMGWIDALTSTEDWKLIKDLEREANELDKKIDEADVSESIDLVKELIEKQEI